METLAADDDQYRRLTADEQDFLNMFHKKAQEFDVAHETMSRLFRYLDLVLHSLGVALPSAAALCASDVLKWRYGAAILSLCGTMCWVVTARAQCGVQQYRHMMLHQKFAEFDHDIRMIFAFDKLNQPTDRVVAVANKYASVLYQSRDAILPHWMHQELSNCAILTANLGQHEPRLPSTKTHLTQQQVANHIDPCVRQAEASRLKFMQDCRKYNMLATALGLLAASFTVVGSCLSFMSSFLASFSCDCAETGNIEMAAILTNSAVSLLTFVDSEHGLAVMAAKNFDAFNSWSARKRIIWLNRLQMHCFPNQVVLLIEEEQARLIQELDGLGLKSVPRDLAEDVLAEMEHPRTCNSLSCPDTLSCSEDSS